MMGGMGIMRMMIVVGMVVAMAGCASPMGKRMSAWWNAPATQNGIHYAVQAGTQFAVQAGLAALQQYAGGGRIDYQKIAVTGGINTLYMQASNIRQLQGTSMVLDPVATARLLEQGGTPEDISRRLAQELFDNATVLIKSGLSPNAAAEVNAAGLDAAAARVAERTGDK
jgi:hypothetical protein